MKSIAFSIILLFGIAYQSAAQGNSAFIVDGYTDKLSYRAGNIFGAGDIATFFINGPSTPDDGTFNLVAMDGTVALSILGFTVSPQTMNPNEPWKNGFGYSPSRIWTVASASTLKSGYYLLENKIPIIIKDANYPSTADIVVVCPTNTINAYTTSGGKSMYYPSLNRATIVSFLRPQSRNDYGHYDDGFFRWLITSGMTNNYNINFISDMDMDDYNEIANAKLLIIPGHSEYWSRQARLNFDKFVDAGKNALILSGNTMWWQVRYETDLNNSQNIQMICHRGCNWSDPPCSNFDDDPIVSTDPLLATYHWGEPSLKYSILGSIGAESLRGGFGVNCGSDFGCYGGFNGFRITLPNSPLITGLGYNLHDLLPFATNEYDGSLMKTDALGKALDANGNVIGNGNADPVLDVSAFGFYRAEMIGYDKIFPNYNHNNDPGNLTNLTYYCPFMVFQKTCTSGTIINVNSTDWCSNWVIGHALTGEINHNGNTNCGTSSTLVPDSRIPQITANIINMMMQDQNASTIGINNGDNLFFNPRPTSSSFSVKPTYTNVSYNACSTGSIHITPCGVYLDEGYKVDNGFTWNYSIVADINNNIFDANIDANCTNYNMGLRHANPNGGNDGNKKVYDEQQITADNKTTEAKNKSASEQIKQSAIGNLPSSISNQQPTITLTPNPSASGVFQLQITSSEKQVTSIVIYNLLGEKIYQQNITSSNQQIDISSYSKGIYFVKVQSGEKLFVQKVIYQ